MTTTLVFSEEEHSEAVQAMKAWAMAAAALEFDGKLRNIIKYDENISEEHIAMYEELRTLHRACWEQFDVRFDK
jgi:hypothetical protein